MFPTLIPFYSVAIFHFSGFISTTVRPEQVSQPDPHHAKSENTNSSTHVTSWDSVFPKDVEYLLQESEEDVDSSEKSEISSCASRAT
jgi:hypothetical protein